MKHVPFISYKKQGRIFTLQGELEVNRFLRHLPIPFKLIAIG